MKRFSFALALLATISMTVIPVAPSQAASPARAETRNELVAKHAAKGDIVVLSRAQMSELERTQPRLHAKLVTANQNATVPKLSASEKRLVRSMTAQNMDAIKAGAEPWTVVAIVAGVLLILFVLTPLGCWLFPWGPTCGPRAVMARG
jgi:hypothetical protein